MKAMNKVWVIGDASVDLVPEKQNSYPEMPRRSVGERGGVMRVYELGGEIAVLLAMWRDAGRFLPGFRG